MKLQKLCVLTLTVVVTLSAFGQTPPTPPSATEMAKRHVKTLTTLLNLTTAQQQQALTIYSNAAKSQQEIQATEREAHENLRTAIRSNDTTTIDLVAATIAQTAGQLTSIRAKADASFFQILSPDQQAKLSELESQHIGLLEHPGPGGPPAAMGFH